MSRSDCAVGASGLVVGGAVSEGGGVEGCVPFTSGEAMPSGGGLIGFQSRWMSRTSGTSQRGLLRALAKSRHVFAFTHNLEVQLRTLTFTCASGYCRVPCMHFTRNDTIWKSIRTSSYRPCAPHQLLVVPAVVMNAK